MKTPSNFWLIIILIFSSELAFAQQSGEPFRVMFYNVENLFDTKDDSAATDEEFLPEGVRNWSFDRFLAKLDHLAKVVIACGGWEAPAIVGFCEVENRYVVEQLLMRPSLEKIKYKIVHKESPDRRGIDVSMIYNSSRFRPIKYRYIPILSGGVPLQTREILYVAGTPDESGDTIHLFFNHWPSRYGGFLETASLRELAAKTLREEIDRLFRDFSRPKILIMGDFNDQPSDKSISEILGAGPAIDVREPGKLINLSSSWEGRNSGTIKYQSQWLIYDQIIVSGSMMNSNKAIFCKPGDSKIFRMDFLLERDNTYGGDQPFRTFEGFRYSGGFSDHLPVYTDLFLN